MNADASDAPVGRYADDGYTLARGLVSPDVLTLLSDHASLLLESGRLKPDHQVIGSSVVYGDPAFDALLKGLTPRASELTDLPLLPTYSFVRLYRRGQELAPHRDRVECQHSATVHIASDQDGQWPIWLRSVDRPPVEVGMAPGDGVLYRGDQLLHWRDPLPHEWQLQVFLHWVDADGPHADRVYDRRPGLGRSEQEKRR